MIRVALVDDHAVVREGYRALLSRQEDMEVVAEFGDADSAYRDISDTDVDICVMDINMPGASALGVLARLHQRNPDLNSLVFSMYANANYARQAFAAGARGYVTKSSAPEVLLDALRQLAQGQRYIAADIAELLALDAVGSEHAAAESLTPREFDVLRLLLSGADVEMIADSLKLSPKTVRNLHYTVKGKLGVRDDIDLVRSALRLNLIDLNELNTRPADTNPSES